MKKNKILIIFFLILQIFVINCGGKVREALEGQKRSDQSDEFLVKKKKPLKMPPDIDKLPKPGDTIIEKSKSEDTNVKELLNIENNSKPNDQESGSSNLLNEMLKKIE